MSTLGMASSQEIIFNINIAKKGIFYNFSGGI